MNRETLVCKIASFVYATAVLNTYDGGWLVDFEEIEDVFGHLLKKPLSEDAKLCREIKAELHTYKGLEGEDDCVIIEEDGFNTNLWTDYIGNDYEAEEDAPATESAAGEPATNDEDDEDDEDSDEDEDLEFPWDYGIHFS